MRPSLAAPHGNASPIQRTHKRRAARQIGAPLLATILLALSFMVVSHPPPIGPIGLLCFASAVALLARAQRVSSRLDAGAPTPIPT